MTDDQHIGERLARIEAAIERLTTLVGQQHAALLREIDNNIFDIHRNIQSRACQDSAEYVHRHMQGVPRFDDRVAFLRNVAELARQLSGDVLEFGVSGGVSLKLFCEALPDRRVYGFDSFQGLPEDWYLTTKKGAYAYAAEDLTVPPNGVLVPGLFEDSLPKFLEGFAGPVSMIHIDSDVYSSAVTVLRHVRPLIAPGCLIVFDEYMNYASWRDHEFKAWREFVSAHAVRYEYIGYTRRGFQCAVRVTAIGQ